ncbi:hypothetical protein AAE478_003129 [Parahypoxylon ruwenzoriense]
MAASRLADSSVPDGGYGWVVVLGCAVMTWWFVGTSYSWGVIQSALVERGLSSPSTLSFVGSLSAALISALAIVNSRVARLLGARKTGMLGIALLGLAEVLSSFSVTNLAGLFITSGVLLGGSPIAGYLLEAYGGTENGLQAYRPAMFYAGSMALGAAVLVALMRFRLSRHPLAKF